VPTRYGPCVNDVLSPASRMVRVVVTVVAGALLLAGSVWGTDDHFPFGPFSMYAGVNPPNEPAPDTRVEGVDASGAVVVLGERNSGIRRAEIEGQIDAYKRDPGRLSQVATAYTERNPGASPLTEVRIVVRLHEIKSSRPTGKWTDETVVAWRP
jgi:hypothetical protein